MVVGALSTSAKCLGPCTVQTDTRDRMGEGSSRMSLSICLVAQPLVQQKNLTDRQASKSHLHAMALSVLGSPTHGAPQGSVPATEDTVVQGY